jgi:hypothetical protein
MLRDAPSFCGEIDWPGREDAEAWGDWSRRETTPDQLRLEQFLEARPLPDATILHLGCGNSSLARRLAGRVKRIDGVTIYPGEKSHGESLELQNYRIVLLNKYGPGLSRLPDQYDFVVDNNPASYACCVFHVERLLRDSLSLLAPGGAFLTEALGLQWVAAHTPPSLSMDFEDLVRFGFRSGFVALRETESIYSLRRPA